MHDDEMMYVCAWCLAEGKDPHIRGPRLAPPHMVSHGICLEHVAKLGEDVERAQYGNLDYAHRVLLEECGISPPLPGAGRRKMLRRAKKRREES